jgi:hypothetical protein
MRTGILLVGFLTIGASLSLAAGPGAKHPPLSLNPDNPHYFLFRGSPTVLIGSGEHYGAVLNLDFDYFRYLDALAADHLDHTRLFSGTYHEPAGAFGIAENTLAPKPAKYVAPWKRASVRGGNDGGNKFDLTQFDPAYFNRLKDFLAKAGERNIVVEVNLFSPNYDDSIWSISPMNSANNVNGVGAVAGNEVYTLKHPGLLKVQDETVRRIVSACREFDNLYFEVCNEPYFGGVTTEWQDHIVDVIRDTEKDMSPPHLISMNFANGSKKIDKPNRAVSIFNFHYCYPPDAVAENSGLKCVIGENETGFKGSGDDYYRMEAWNFILAGGGLFDNLDYSFTVSHPDGSLIGYKAPGGGSAALRKELRTLHEFIDGFDFVRMKPDDSVVKTVLPKGMTVRALVEPGKQYSVYLRGGKRIDLKLDLPAGKYNVRWIDPKSGEALESTATESTGQLATLHSPPCVDDLALGIKRAK